ncbi:phosphorothioated DNA-binding restriction endonuclease [Streptomyces aidingensis]|uniref:Putative restriction endonuclease n=1 Tax=Streptomyces aidingensis TaxID=910347 RepID=A0A1I1V8Q7_9ACTN|nr:HNH endonuclease [Streptomyces aidingensis]SFD79377.1 putative restriction endonuclease [Streptomyces aidingensis]
MTREELLALLGGLRRAPVGGRRAPHKPLLVLWLLGRFAAHGTTAVGYADAEEPVSRIINDFGPVVKSPSLARQRAAMPFVHLERELWDPRDADGRPIPPEAPERGAWLRERGAHGRLRPEAEAVLADPVALAAAVQLLIDQHFTPALEMPLREATGLDLTTSLTPAEAAARHLVSTTRQARQRRTAGFAEQVLRAYAYACAMCGFDGALGRNPVGLEAAHIKWHSQGGPDDLPNALALCALHHTLFDLGVLGLTDERRIRVSAHYVARSSAGRAVDELHGRPLAEPRPGVPAPSSAMIGWHSAQVYKHPARSGRSVPCGGGG